MQKTFTQPTDEKTLRIFTHAYDIGRSAAKNGKVADYIPELAKADPNAFGIYMLNADGGSIALGDCNTRFSIQSVPENPLRPVPGMQEGHRPHRGCNQLWKMFR